MPKAKTTAEFVAKAQAVHGLGKYDYSSTVYAPRPQKISIGCPQHGVFMQTGDEHLSGGGCKKCATALLATARSLTKDDFVAKAQATHGVGTYDYSQVVYSGSEKKVTIICPTHGPFEQKAANHLQGKRCIKCAGLFRGGTAHYIEKAQAKHGDKYDYSQVEYTHAHVNITIICPTHGPFEQKATNHLTGAGCGKCTKKGAPNLGIELFVKKARQAHGDRYDYSRVAYKNNSTNVLINCPEHGLFEQMPSVHMEGGGCRHCRNEVGHFWGAEGWAARQRGRKALLYLVKFTGHGETFYKAGITFTSVAKRFSGVRRSPYKVEPVAVFQSVDAWAVFNTEATIKGSFRHLQYLPDKRFAGYTECYADQGPLLAFLKNSNLELM